MAIIFFFFFGLDDGEDIEKLKASLKEQLGDLLGANGKAHNLGLFCIFLFRTQMKHQSSL